MWFKFSASLSPQKPPKPSDKIRQLQKGNKGAIMILPPVVWGLRLRQLPTHPRKTGPSGWKKAKALKADDQLRASQSRA